MSEVLKGVPVSKGNLKKITIYSDRLEAKEFLSPIKAFPLDEIKAWSETQVIQNPGNIRYLRLTIYTQTKQYSILSLYWQNYMDLRNILTYEKKQVDEKPKNNTKLILGIIIGIIVLLGGIFAADYFQTQSLLKNGIRAKAEVTSKYYELNTDSRDTSYYFFRLSVVADTANGKSIYQIPERLQAFVNQKSFNKYSEGSIVNVVYDKDDLDHAKLVEEIE